MNASKIVSCVIPTYRRNDTLPRAIGSVLNQTYSNIEILVVDDNEPGDEFFVHNVELLKQYERDGRVRHIRQEHHTNGAIARNVGIKAARGEYIAFLDDDDEWLPTKIEKQVKILETSTDIGGVSCLYHEMSNGKIVHSCPSYTGDNIHRKIFQRSVAVFTSTVLLRRESLLKAGLFNPTLKRHQDLQLLLDFTRNNKFEVLDEYLVILHIDSGINRPSYDRLLKIKQDFFAAVKNHFDIYSKKEQKVIRSSHKFELAFSAIKEKKYLKALGHIISVGPNLAAFKLLQQRMQDRKYIAK